MRQLTFIRNNRYRRTNLPRAWGLLAALAVALACPAMASADRFPADPVEELRQALRPDQPIHPFKEVLDFRRKNLQNKIDALGTVGDLGRALLLQEWRDEESDREAAAIDRAVRTQVADRFEKAVRAWLERGDESGRAAVADFVREMAVLAGSVGCAANSPRDA